MSGTLGGRDFAIDVSAWCDKAVGRGRAAFLAIGLDALSRVKELTPVRTGNLRAGWQLTRRADSAPVDRETVITASGLATSLAAGAAGAKLGAVTGAVFGPGGVAVGGILGGVAGGLAGDEAGAAAARALTAPNPVEQVELGEVLVIQNAVVYARRIELGWEIERKDGGITKVEGRGMMAQTISELPRIADAAVARVMQASG